MSLYSGSTFIAIENLGTALPSPFATLSFLALPVIPELRLTDLGLVDVNEFRLISFQGSLKLYSLIAAEGK